VDKERIKRLYGYLKKEGIEAFLFTSPENIRYISGFTGGEGMVFLTPHKRVLFVDSRYVLQAKKEAKRFTVKEYIERWEDVVSLIKNEGCRNLGFESYHLTHESYVELKRQLKVPLIQGPRSIKNIRSVKEQKEISLIRKAAEIAEQGFKEIIPQIANTPKEKDIALRLECSIKELGSEKTPFEIIVVSGKRGAHPHGTPGKKEIRKGEFVTIDFGAVYRGYCSDETCTLIVGRPTLQQKKVYELVKEAHDQAISVVTPGVKFTTIDSVARRVLENAGLGKYFRHGTGHGVGLAVHEAPSISPKGEGVVKEGMVFTIEPGVYIPNWGGVRIEDMVEVTRHGCQLITGISKDLQLI
jgi:Xaa-Pro aminopeptidase